MKSLFGNRSSKTKDAAKDYPPPPPPPPPPRERSSSPTRRTRQDHPSPSAEKDPNRRDSRSRAGPTSSASRAHHQPPESSHAQPESSHMPTRNGMYNDRAAQQQSPTQSSLSRQSSMGSENMYHRGQSPPRQQQHPAYEGPLTPPPEVPKRMRGQSPPRPQMYQGPLQQGQGTERMRGKSPPRQQYMQYQGPLPEQTPPPENMNQMRGQSPPRQQYMPNGPRASVPTPPQESPKRTRGVSPPPPPRQQQSQYPIGPPPQQFQYPTGPPPQQGQYQAGQPQQAQGSERSRGPSPPQQQYPKYQGPAPGPGLTREISHPVQTQSPPRQQPSQYPAESPKQVYGPENIQRNQGQSPPRPQMVQITTTSSPQGQVGGRPKRSSTNDFSSPESDIQLSQSTRAAKPRPATPVKRNDDDGADKINRAIEEAVQPLKSRIDELKNELQVFHKAAEEEQKTNEGLWVAIEEEKAAQALLLQKCESISKDRDNLKKVLGAMGEAYKGRGLKYEDTVKMDELKEQVENLRKSEEQANERITELTSENDALRVQNAGMERDLGDIHNHLLCMETDHGAEVKRLNDEYRTKTKELKDDYTKTKAGLERDLQSTIKRLRSQHQEEMLQAHEYFTSEIDARDQQLADMKAEMAALQAQLLRDKRTEAANLEKTIIDATNLQKEMLQTFIDSNDAVQRLLGTDLTRRRSEIQRLESSSSPSTVSSQRRESNQSPTQQNTQSDERRRERMPLQKQLSQESSNGARKRSSTNASTYSQEAHHSPNMNGPVVPEQQGTPASDTRSQQSQSPTTIKPEAKAANPNKLTKGGTKRSSSFEALRHQNIVAVPAAQFHRQSSSPVQGTISSPVYTIQAQQYNGDPRWEVPSQG